jgi:endonuclease III
VRMGRPRRDAPTHGTLNSKMTTKLINPSRRKDNSHNDPSSLKSRAKKIIQLLKRAYPDAKCSLNHSNAFELLIATILSAQCTDERVNIVTADLFRKYRKPEDYLKVPASELQSDIRTTGFFRNKTKSIQGTAKVLTEQYAGRVPETIEELLELPGVARKTANVVLGNAFGVTSGIVVDTHVTRLSRRLALTQQKHPEKIENDLVAIVPRKDWVIFSHLLIAHGRKICKARNPRCAECVIEKYCPSSYLKTGVIPGSY